MCRASDILISCKDIVFVKIEKWVVTSVKEIGGESAFLIMIASHESQHHVLGFSP